MHQSWNSCFESLIAHKLVYMCWCVDSESAEWFAQLMDNRNWSNKERDVFWKEVSRSSFKVLMSRGSCMFMYGHFEMFNLV